MDQERFQHTESEHESSLEHDEEEAVRSTAVSAQTRSSDVPPPAASAAELSAKPRGGQRSTPSDQALGPLPKPDKTSAEASPKKADAKGEEAKKPKDAPEDWTWEKLDKLIKEKSAAAVFQTLGVATLSEGDAKKAFKLLRDHNAIAGITNGLPDGAAMPKDLRAALLRLVRAGAVSLDETKKLFKKRFKQDLKDDTSTWSLGTIQVVWKQLDVLPDHDVTDDTVNKTLAAVQGGGGTQSTLNIDIGQAGGASMPHTVRHEVGHAVHDKLGGTVDSWLKGEMDFFHFEKTVAAVEKWIDELGGYPADYDFPKGTKKPFDAAAKTAVAAKVESWMGKSRWDPTRAAVPQTDEEKAQWKAMPNEVTNAVQQSVSHWYGNYKNFQKKGSRYYFLNHWYHWPFHMGEKAFKIIPKTGENYSAMSHYEFFANCYAKFFENPEGVNDPKKWGGGLPDDVQSFFQQCIVQRHPYKNAEDRKKNT